MRTFQHLFANQHLPVILLILNPSSVLNFTSLDGSTFIDIHFFFKFVDTGLSSLI